MAKKEEKGDPYIDYEEATAEDEPTKKWNSTAFKKYWAKLLTKHHHMYSASWTIKDTTLLSTMIKEFSPEALSEMMEWWMSNKPSDVAWNFTNFYSNRHRVFVHSREWQWN